MTHCHDEPDIQSKWLGALHMQTNNYLCRGRYTMVMVSINAHHDQVCTSNRIIRELA